jgi:LAO/AO transport system kinase
MLVCEAAGFDVILVETIGVGQSEITVRSMVDFFLLLQIAGGGDELQGFKKGVMELADALVVNKADGDNKQRAEAARQDFEMALHYIAPATGGWSTHAFTCSAFKGEGIPEIWNVVEKFRRVTTGSGIFEQRRRRQLREWMLSMVKEHLQELFFQNPDVQSILAEIEAAVIAGTVPATTAAQNLLNKFEESLIRQKKK